MCLITNHNPGQLYSNPNDMDWCGKIKAEIELQIFFSIDKWQKNNYRK